LGGGTLKANESGVNGTALPEVGWVDLSTEDRILQFHPAVKARRAVVGHTREDADQTLL
jgi:hypothetical protein